MGRPEWVPAAAWQRLDAVLRRQPEHADDALADLFALVASWDLAARAQLLERFLIHAESGLPLPAAVISALWDLLDRDG